jgi:hypothetical protein
MDEDTEGSPLRTIVQHPPSLIRYSQRSLVYFGLECEPHLSSQVNELRGRQPSTAGE